MKKILIMLIASYTALLPITNLTSSISQNNIHTTKVEVSPSEQKIKYLDQSYHQRTTTQNQAMEINLSSSITLVKNQIMIDYNNLNQKIFDKNMYQMLLSTDYLKTLTIQCQMHQVKFDANNHIIFLDNSKLLRNGGVWIENHWYWLGYWRLHLGYAICRSIIGAIGAVAMAAGKSSIAMAVIEYMLDNWIIGVIVATIALLIVGTELILLTYNHGNGVWFGLWSVFLNSWGSN